MEIVHFLFTVAMPKLPQPWSQLDLYYITYLILSPYSRIISLPILNKFQCLFNQVLIDNE